MKLLTLIMLFNYSIIDDIRHVLKYLESNNYDHAVGDSGHAFGVLQIHAIAVREANQDYGTNYTHSQMFSGELAEEVFNLNMRYGVELYYRKFKRYPSEEDLVRMWNGGIYNGYNNKNTKKYYQNYLKIKRYVIQNQNTPLPDKYESFREGVHYHGRGRQSPRWETVSPSGVSIPMYSHESRHGVEGTEMVFVGVYDRRRSYQNGLLRV